MAWRDNLLEGALDDAPFLYEVVTNHFGRRTSVHEYPDRDAPYTDDFGRSARKFTIRAFVIGENYANARDALIEVCEAPGDKEFAHPYRGVFGVKVTGECSMTERTNRGRYAEFSIPLVEAGLALPSINILTLPNIGLLVPDLLGKLPDTKFNLLAAIGAVLSSIIGGMNKAASALRKVNGKIAGALGLVDSLSGAIDAFASELGTLIATPGAMLAELVQLCNSVVALVGTFVELVPTGTTVPTPDFVGVALDVLEDLFSFESLATTIPTPTPQSIQEVAAHLALTDVFKASALGASTGQLSTFSLASADQAKSIQTNLSDKFEAMQVSSLEPEAMESLAALKDGMIHHFSTQARILPRVTTVTNSYTDTALTLAYRLHKNSSLDEDIIRRNGIRHPTFLPALTPLEVLSGS